MVDVLVGQRARMLSPSSLDVAIRRCQAYPNYEVAIFAANRNDVYSILRDIFERNKAAPIHGCEKIYQASDGTGDISFLNGSRIYIKRFSHDRAAGNRYNLALISDAIHIQERVDRIEVFASILNWCHYHAKPYIIRDEACNDTVNDFCEIEASEELLDFLYSIAKSNEEE